MTSSLRRNIPLQAQLLGTLRRKTLEQYQISMKLGLIAWDNLGRHRMALADDESRDQEVWSNVARFRYNKASDNRRPRSTAIRETPISNPNIGRPCVAMLPNVRRQLEEVSRSLLSTVTEKSKNPDHSQNSILIHIENIGPPSQCLPTFKHSHNQYHQLPTRTSCQHPTLAFNCEERH